MIRKVSITGAATPDGLCSVAAGEMGFIPVCIWQVWMRMGWWASLSCFPQENPWEYYDLWSTRTMFPILPSEPVKLERRKVERGIVSRKRVPVKVR